MKVVPLYCPNCGAPVGKDAKFCSQCGSPIVIDDGVQRSEFTYRKIDEAKIRETSAQEQMRLKELEAQIAKKKAQSAQVIFALIAFAIMWVVMAVIAVSH